MHGMRRRQVKTMKKRLTLTIDEELIELAKAYSKKEGKTLSKTVEGYFHLMGVMLRDEREEEGDKEQSE